MFQFAYIYSQMKRGLIPDIYIQTDEYFKDFESDIKAMFGTGISFDPRIALHIRRGDYVGNSFYTDLSATDYYKKAIDMFPGERFLVFCKDRQPGNKDSEDMKWVKEYLTPLLGDRFDIWDGVDEIADMNKMAGCKDIIMANSSFSWWAAYLNPNPIKKVIAPKQWFSDGVERVKLPKEWLTL